MMSVKPLTAEECKQWRGNLIEGGITPMMRATEGNRRYLALRERIEALAQTIEPRFVTLAGRSSAAGLRAAIAEQVRALLDEPEDTNG